MVIIMDDGGVEDGFKKVSKIAKEFDEFHRDVGLMTRKITLKDLMVLLVNKLGAYFDPGETPTLINSDARDFLYALSYTDYILRYLHFIFWNPDDTIGLCKSTVDAIAWMAPKIATSSAYLREDTKRIAEEKFNRIFTTLEAFRELKHSYAVGKTNPILPMLLLDKKGTELLVQFRNVVTAPCTEGYNSNLQTLKTLCQTVKNIYEMDDLTDIVVDLVMSSIVSFVQEFIQFLVIAKKNDNTELVLLVRMCLEMSWSMVEIDIEMRIPCLHRFMRLDLIRMICNTEPAQLVEEVRLPPPNFHYPPTSQSTVTPFWGSILYTFDNNLPEFFYCPLCTSNNRTEKAVIFDTCSHTCCYACCYSWFHKKAVCPKCSAQVYNWTSWEIARPFLVCNTTRTSAFINSIFN